jgi:ribosomal-protein-alanine N-acetyltransferase
MNYRLQINFSVHRRLYGHGFFLRRLSVKDAAEYGELLKKNRDFLIKWSPYYSANFNKSNVVNWIKQEQKAFKTGERIDLGIFCIRSKKLLGRIALHSICFGVQRSAGLSYWIDENFKNCGYITKALAAIVSFAFEELRLHRIWARITPDNHSSLRVCQKLGFRKEGRLSETMFLDHKWQDTFEFALLEKEYDYLADSWIAKGYLGNH